MSRSNRSGRPGRFTQSITVAGHRWAVGATSTFAILRRRNRVLVFML
jgi:hypothetical protein